MTAKVAFTKQHRQQIQRGIGHDKIAIDMMDMIEASALPDNPATLNLTSAQGSQASGNAGQVHFETITLTALPITMVDGGANGSIGSTKIMTLPQGLIAILGARFNLTVAASGTPGIATGGVLKMSMGTAPAATNDTLNLTKANIIESKSTTLLAFAGAPAAVSKSTAIVAFTDNSGGTASDTLAVQTGSYVQATIQNSFSSIAAKIAEIIARLNLNGNRLAGTFDGTTTAIPIYLNAAVADADSASNDVLTVSGTITFAWELIGSP